MVAALLLGSEQLCSACLDFRVFQDLDACQAIRLDVHRAAALRWGRDLEVTNQVLNRGLD